MTAIIFFIATAVLLVLGYWADYASNRAECWERELTLRAYSHVFVIVAMACSVVSAIAGIAWLLSWMV